MAQLTALPEINDDDDCQLVSFTNKLPYYVRHLCKSTNKNKTSAVTSNASEYLRKKSQTQFTYSRKEKKTHKR
jgi:P pilus assembly chaperone PapD